MLSLLLIVLTAALYIVGLSPSFSKFLISALTSLSNPRQYLILTVFFLDKSLPVSSNPILYPSVNVSAIFWISSSLSELRYSAVLISLSVTYSPNLYRYLTSVRSDSIIILVAKSSSGSNSSLTLYSIRSSL